MPILGNLHNLKKNWKVCFPSHFYFLGIILSKFLILALFLGYYCLVYWCFAILITFCIVQHTNVGMQVWFQCAWLVQDWIGLQWARSKRMGIQNPQNLLYFNDLVILVLFLFSSRLFFYVCFSYGFCCWGFISKLTKSQVNLISKLN